MEQPRLPHAPELNEYATPDRRAPGGIRLICGSLAFALLLMMFAPFTVHGLSMIEALGGTGSGSFLRLQAPVAFLPLQLLLAILLITGIFRIRSVELATTIAICATCWLLLFIVTMATDGPSTGRLSKGALGDVALVLGVLVLAITHAVLERRRAT